MKPNDKKLANADEPNDGRYSLRFLSKTYDHESGECCNDGHGCKDWANDREVYLIYASCALVVWLESSLGTLEDT